MKIFQCSLFVIFFLSLISCGDHPLNNPYPKSQHKSNILYSSFNERPKTLDPARAYSSNEYLIISQIYEPPLQYHYLLRPYTLVPLTAQSLPKIEYLDKNHHVLLNDTNLGDIAYTRYTIAIKPGRYYQPHPAFAKDKNGQYYYHHLNKNYLDENEIYSLDDFSHKSTRELVADDYVYQIKRLAHPQAQSPILGLMSEYIVGLSQLNETLTKINEKFPSNEQSYAYIDLRKFPFEGASVVDRYHYTITIKGKYPQFIYWLAMPFFSPVPWEADVFDSQPDMLNHNISLDWFPIGTGPYQLTENNPNRRMVLQRNPNFSGEAYPSEGSKEDKALGLLADAGKPLPMIDAVMFILEKESIPRWSKFLQGYYDNSGISSDSFDQAIHVDEKGEPELTNAMKKQRIKLYTSVSPSISYMGFNMLDPVVGGYGEKARKLRQAISIALDYNEYISIFLNGRGIVAQGPLPPGIFGYEEGQKGVNPIIFDWKNNHIQRKNISVAQRLMVEAGYPNGHDEKTGKQLILNYDVPITSGPDEKSMFDWLRKEFSKLGIELNIRDTQYNQFQERMRLGNAQIFSWGWNADYPDPENFLFLLYSPNGKVKFYGENATNYANPEYDKLFVAMKNIPNGEERLAIIRKMVSIVQYDAPWIWGLFPESFTLSHDWNRVIKPNEIANNTLKYSRLDPILRAEQRQLWNQPIWWPILLYVGLLLLSGAPVVIHYWRKLHRPKV